VLLPIVLINNDSQVTDDLVKQLLQALTIQNLKVALIRKLEEDNKLSYSIAYELTLGEHTLILKSSKKISQKLIESLLSQIDVIIAYGNDIDIIKSYESVILVDCKASAKSNLKKENVIVCDVKDLQATVKEVLSRIGYWQEIKRIYNELPKLDCGRCGYEKCVYLAQRIYSGDETIKKCVVLEQMKKSVTRIFVEKQEIQVITYIAELFRKTILAMVSTLKGVNINGDETIEIRIKKRMGK